MLEWILVFLLLALLAVLFAKYASLRGSVEARARELFYEWRAREEKRIREDAAKRSQATLLGRIGEHMAPLLLLAEHGINPRDARFLGDPVDYVVFKGLSEGRPEKIVFVEVKSGRSTSLTRGERSVKALVEEKRVEWLLLHLPSELGKLHR